MLYGALQLFLKLRRTVGHKAALTVFPEVHGAGAVELFYGQAPFGGTPVHASMATAHSANESTFYQLAATSFSLSYLDARTSFRLSSAHIGQGHMCA